MKIENFKSRPMRQVEYFGETISIPADHEWVVTTLDGFIFSSTVPLCYEAGNWVTDNVDLLALYAVGSCDAISDEDEWRSMRHFPVGDTNE